MSKPLYDVDLAFHNLRGGFWGVRFWCDSIHYDAGTFHFGGIVEPEGENKFASLFKTMFKMEKDGELEASPYFSWYPLELDGKWEFDIDHECVINMHQRTIV